MKSFRSLLKGKGVAYALFLTVLAVVSIQRNLVADTLSKISKDHRSYSKALKDVAAKTGVKGNTLNEKGLNLVRDGKIFLVEMNPVTLDSVHWAASVTSAGAVQLRRFNGLNGMSVYAESADVVARLKALPGVKSVTQDSIAKINNCSDSESCATLSSAPAGETQWSMTKINADKVWTNGTGCGVKVCVVDSGVDKTHPDLATQIGGGTNNLALEDDKTSEEDRDNFNDDHGHGTHVSGIIAGAANGVGIIGVAPTAKIYASRVFDASGFASYETITAGVDYCNSINADVINMSLGGGTPQPLLDAAIQAAVDRGAVVVISAGNSGNGKTFPGKDTVSYPGNTPSVMTVAASDENDAIAEFSSEGPTVDIIAPGTVQFLFDNDATIPGNQWFDKGILSSIAGYNAQHEPFMGDSDEKTADGKKYLYGRMSGTSMAAPHVAGAAALLKSLHPEKSGAEIMDAMKAGAKDIGLGATRQGAGRLNLEGALAVLDGEAPTAKK